MKYIGNYRYGWNAQFFLQVDAVANDRWRTGASMAGSHYHGISLGFNFRPQLRIIRGEAARLPAKDSLNLRMVFCHPVHHFVEQDIAPEESIIDEIHSFAIQAIQPGRHRNQFYCGWNTARVIYGDIRVISCQ